MKKKIWNQSLYLILLKNYNININSTDNLDIIYFNILLYFEKQIFDTKDIKCQLMYTQIFYLNIYFYQIIFIWNSSKIGK